MITSSSRLGFAIDLLLCARWSKACAAPKLVNFGGRHAECEVEFSCLYGTPH
jgi:hypothetical protein